MTESPAKPPGFAAQIASYPPSFWIANTMEIFERMAWYGFFALSTLYITGPVETGGLGFTSEQRGAIQAMIPFLLYLMPVVTGALADRYGFKRMFLISYVAMVVSYYALGQFKTLPTFMLAFFCVAVAAAIFKPVVVGTIARLTDESNSRMGFGIFYMMVNIGGFFGPIVAGVVRGISWDYVFVASSAWAAVNLLICILFYREPPRPPEWQPRRLDQVWDSVVEVLGNGRFFLTVMVVIVAMMVAQLGPSWFGWWEALFFIPSWLVLNFLWDLLARPMPGAGEPRISWLAQRMVCSNPKFALYLLILSGFWTAFNQIFLTMPEYIRDFSETRPLVDASREALGPAAARTLASVEEAELYTEIDRIIRQARGKQLLNGEDHSGDDGDMPAMGSDRSGVTPAMLSELEQIAGSLNQPGAEHPLTAKQLLASTYSVLSYKVRWSPVEYAQMLAQIPTGPVRPSDAALSDAIDKLNKARSMVRQLPVTNESEVKQAVASLLETHGPVPPPDAAQAVASNLSTADKPIELRHLAAAIRAAAYYDVVYPKLDVARQVNPEFIVNLNALGIVLFQVLVSFLIARFHQFTGMILGMIVAAVGIGLSTFAGDHGFFGSGGSVIIVCAGILIFSFGEMMASPTSQEYVGRIAPRDKVAMYMGYYFVAVALGNLFGGILSGQLYGKLARDMQRPDLMWAAFGGIMLATALIFVVYNQVVLRKPAQA